MPDLVCPKCQSPMRSYERNGVTVDQCTGCRGVFLDRGELERLVDAESAFYERAAEQPRREHRADDDDRHRSSSHDSYGHGFGGHGKHGKRRKKSFLDDVFDFG